MKYKETIKIIGKQIDLGTEKENPFYYANAQGMIELMLSLYSKELTHEQKTELLNYDFLCNISIALLLKSQLD